MNYELVLQTCVQHNLVQSCRIQGAQIIGYINFTIYFNIKSFIVRYFLGYVKLIDKDVIIC